ncbi:MAG: heavy metal translocating P-type ATPase [Ornithinimicrobium sp.]
MSTTTSQPRQVDLMIGGMTCASCVSRVEGSLNKLPGVQASVNLATEKARVSYTDPQTIEDLVAAVATTGYTARPASQRHTAAPGSEDQDAQGGPTHDGSLNQADHMNHQVIGDRALRVRAVVASVLALLVLLLAMVPPVRDAAGAAGPWLQLVLTSPVYLWAAWPFHRAAAINGRHGASTMDTLVSIGVTAAYGWSVVALLTGFTQDLYFETAAIVTAFLLIGRYVESRAKAAGRSALTALLELGSAEVAVLRHDPRSGAWREHRIATDDLAAGDRFVVRPGEKIATDGEVIEGRSAVDTSMVTGESVPVDVEPGMRVTGATMNAHGRLVVRATRVGADTTLAQITRLVEDAQTGRAPVQRLADRVSAVFVPVVLIIAALTFLGWLVTGHDVGTSLAPAVAVLIIACPCALGLATPTALLTGTGRGAQLGILIKGPQILESTRAVDTVVLDKTGTITTGQATLSDVTTHGRLASDAALIAAAAVESGSEHPIARAIAEAAEQRSLAVPAVSDFASMPGQGARARIKDTEVTVGKAELFDQVPESLLIAAKQSGTTVLLGWSGRARAALTVTDRLRPTSAAAIEELRGLGLKPHLLTGDDEQTAKTIAKQVGIPAAQMASGVLPADKHAYVTALQDQGRVVAMVGDGVNDAAALAQADLGLAMASGTDVAAESADIVLMRADLGSVVTAVALSRQTLRTIKQNLGWAFGYNAAAIPLAAFGLLSPMIAGAAMAASSVLVVLNGLRLRRFGR